MGRVVSVIIREIEDSSVYVGKDLADEQRWMMLHQSSKIIFAG